MVEIVGLAFGTVTLVTLFDTCVEFLDYCEDARNLANDIKTAVTKVYLLRPEIHQWEQELAIDRLGPGEGTLRQPWPNDSNVILKGLGQITEILGSNTLLTGRYQSNGKVSCPTVDECVGNTWTQKELSFYQLCPAPRPSLHI